MIALFVGLSFFFKHTTSYSLCIYNTTKPPSYSCSSSIQFNSTTLDQEIAAVLDEQSDINLQFTSDMKIGEFNLQSFAITKEISLSVTGSYLNTVTLKYKNNLNAQNIKLSTSISTMKFEDIDSTESSNLILGSLSLSESYKIESDNLNLYLKSASLHSSHLKNLRSLHVIGDSDFKLSTADSFDMNVHSDHIEINDTPVYFKNQLQLSCGGFMGSRGVVNITGVSSPSTIPNFTMSGVSEMIIQGDFGDSTFIPEIKGTSVKATIKSSTVPFSIAGSSSLDFILQGSVKFLGKIEGTSNTGCSFDLESESQNEVNVEVDNDLVGRVLVKNPAIQLTLKSFIMNSYGSIFPIIPSISEKMVSKITVKNYSNKYDFTELAILSKISKAMTDEELEKEGFKSGKTLIVIPEGSDEIPTSTNVGYYSGSTSIFGFSAAANCLSMTNNTKSGNIEIGIKASSLSGLKYSICYSTSSDDCKNAVIMTKDPQYFSRLDQELPSSPPTKNIEFTIGTASSTIVVDLDKYNFDGSNLTIVGKPSFYTSVAVDIINTKKTIKALDISNIQLDTNCTLSADIVSLSSMKVLDDVTVSFQEGTSLFTDSSILSSLLSTVTKQLTIALDDSSTVIMSDDGWVIAESLVPYDRTENMIMSIKKLIWLQSNATKQTQVPGFNITTSSDSKVTLKGNWNNLVFGSSLYINHYNYVLNLIYTKAGQGSEIVFVGNGKVHTSLSYENAIDLCVDFPEETKCYSNRVLSTNFSTALLDYASQEYDNITVRAPGSSAEKRLEFNYHDINMLDIKFYSEIYSSEVIYVKMLLGEKQIDTKYSMLTLSKANVDIDVTSNKELVFGELDFYKANFTSPFRSFINLKVDNLVADYSNLEQFRNITVTDRIYLSGETLPSTESHVYLLQDQNGNDLEAVLPANPANDLIVSAGKLTYGTAVFHISRSENYDALIDLDLCRNLNVVYDNVSDITQIPKMTIKSYSVSTISFYGKYPTSSEDIFQIISPSSLSSSSSFGALIGLRVDSIVPLSVIGVGQIEFEALSNECGFSTADISLERNSQYQGDYLTVKSNITDRAQVSIKQLNLVSSEHHAAISIVSPNVDVKIGAVSKVSNSYQGFFTMNVDTNDVPSISISSPIPNDMAFKSVKINVEEFPIKYDEKSAKIFSGQKVIFSVAQKSIPENFEGIIEGGTGVAFNPLHGITTGECVFIFREGSSNGMASFIMGAAKLPSVVPMTVLLKDDYSGSGNDAEIELSMNQVSSLPEKLPNYVQTLTIYVKANTYESYPIDLSQMYSFTSYLELISFDGQSKNVYLSMDKIDALANLRTKDIRLKLSSTNSRAEPNLKGMNFVAEDTEIDSSIKITSDSFSSMELDVDSVSSIVKNKNIKGSYEKPVAINSLYSIEFAKDGWNVKENEVVESSLISFDYFKDITFKATGSLHVDIAADGVLKNTSIKVMKDRYEEPSVYLSSGWSSVKEAEGISISGEGLRVHSDFFPLPNLFAEPIEKVTFDSQKQITLAANSVINNSVEFDVTSLPEEKQSIKGSDLTLQGYDLSLTFLDKVGQLELETLTFANNTEVNDIQNVVISKYLKMAPITTGGGSLNFATGALIEMDWEHDHVPSLLYYPKDSTLSPKLRLNFIDKDYNKANYESIAGKDFTLVKGDFDCENMKANVDLTSFPDVSYLSLKCVSRFNHSNLLLEIGNLSPDASKDKSASLAIILGTTIPVVVVACIVVGIVAHCLTKKKYEKLLNNSALQSEAGEPNYTDMESDI